MAKYDKPTDVIIVAPNRKPEAIPESEPITEPVGERPALSNVEMIALPNSSDTGPLPTGLVVTANIEAHKPICWRSGDWQSAQSMVPPYNGLEIRAVPKYDTAGTLESVDVTIADYSLDSNGAETQLHCTLEQILNEREFPVRPQSANSTLEGSIKFRLLQGAPDHANLFFSLRYGLVSTGNKNVQGCGLQVALTLPKDRQ